MKSADIKAGPVYGYSEDRDHIYRYSPVLVLSTDLYMTSRFGQRRFGRADAQYKTMKRGGGYSGTSVVMMTVWLSDAGLENVERVRELATAEAAVEALNDGTGRDITDGTNAQTGQPVVLGTYRTLTSARYLHGDYAELTAEIEARKQRRDAEARQLEDRRLANLARYRELSARLTAQGYQDSAYVGDHSNPASFRLSFAVMEALLDKAEAYDHGLAPLKDI